MFPTTVIAAIQMLHIPDGFLTLTLSVICWLLSAVAIALAVRNAREAFDERLIPLAGIMAAFIFAGQMINFPVAGGTSGHLVGATLAAVVLGPWMGILVMTAVISLQALLFQDGGLVVMGANILVMGVIPVMVGYGFYRAVINRGRKFQLLIFAVAAWLSIMAAAFVAALFLGLSGTSSLNLAVPAMVGIHALIGIGEALISVAALNFIVRTRPQLLKTSAEAGGRSWIVAGVVIVLLVLFLTPLASNAPDGLEWVAARNDFLEKARETPFSILSGYTIPALGDSSLSTILAGGIGTLAVAIFIFVLARLIRRTRKAGGAGQ